ncbi:conserved hypothetical protein [Ricinus communis]|uniref:Uncharacterized protein n=1 Tax=Ricinus communis TaxID=3988 RepID=B9RDB5_RICCO|nr:conserved hypothetical protein [Ricinus communis]
MSSATKGCASSHSIVEKDFREGIISIGLLLLLSRLSEGIISSDSASYRKMGSF